MPSGHPNKDKLRPLSKHASEVLASLAEHPIRAHLVNAGVFDRLYREDLAEICTRGHLRFVEITPAGRTKLGRA